MRKKMELIPTLPNEITQIIFKNFNLNTIKIGLKVSKKWRNYLSEFFPANLKTFPEIKHIPISYGHFSICNNLYCYGLGKKTKTLSISDNILSSKFIKLNPDLIFINLNILNKLDFTPEIFKIYYQIERLTIFYSDPNYLPKNTNLKFINIYFSPKAKWKPFQQFPNLTKLSILKTDNLIINLEEYTIKPIVHLRNFEDL